MAFEVRKAAAGDADEVLRLRKERNEVYLKNPPDLADSEDWRAAFLHWLTLNDSQILVAQANDQLLGYMIGWIRDNLPMLQPYRLGLISEMSVDGHNKQGGVGTALLADMKKWFQANQIAQIEVQVPRSQAIEQAFWRSVGGRALFDHFKLELE